VGNLSWATTREELLAIFSAFGQVERVDLPRNPGDGRLAGYALIDMSRAPARLAIAQLHGVRLGGRNISVREALGQGAAGTGES
jgi:cold-inducible RNA-binding protein